MPSRIHQGWFLCLPTYTVFIDYLIEESDKSKCCCAIYGVGCSPLAYADDLAAVTMSKYRTDRINDIAYSFSNE